MIGSEINMLIVKKDIDLSILETKYGFKHYDKSKVLMPRYKHEAIQVFYDIPYEEFGGKEIYESFRLKHKEPVIYNRALHITDSNQETIDMIYVLATDRIIKKVEEEDLQKGE